MNLMLAKIKQDIVNVYWEPFATSTPLKQIQQKKALKSTDSVNFLIKKGCNASNILQTRDTSASRLGGSKKSFKTKAHFYFDVNSSSDEDDSKENNKRPVIKINSDDVAKRKSFLDNKCAKESVELSKKIGSNKRLNKSKDKSPAKKAISRVNKLRGKITEGKIVKKLQNRRNSGDVQKQNLNQSEENFNNNDIIKNDLECFKSDKNIDSEYVDSKLGVAQITQKINESISPPSEESQVKITDHEVSKKSESDGSSKKNQLKRKGSKILLITPVKKTKRKKSKDTENKKSLLHSLETAKNLSHHLFSDSIEQELINTLDLTTSDVNEEAAKEFIDNKPNSVSPLKQTKTKAKTKSKPLTNKEVRQTRSSRQVKPPKEFWLPDSQSDEAKPSIPKRPKKSSVKPNNSVELMKTNTNTADKPVDEKKSIGEGDGSATEEGSVNKNSSGKVETIEDKEISPIEYGEKNLNDIKTSPPNTKIIKQDVIKKRKEKKVFEEKKKTGQEKKIFEQEERKVRQKKKVSEEKKKIRQENKISEQEENEINQQKNASDLMVYKKLSDILYSEAGQSGCFTSECWSVKNFKCGVFKLNSKSHISNRTNHNSSFFGGVLINGCLKMKIGNRKLELKEGDMLFVPPLTDWEAHNECESESIVYYWSGRFKS